MNKHDLRIKQRAYDFGKDLAERAFEITKLLENEPSAVFEEADFKPIIEKGAKEFMGAARLSVKKEAQAVESIMRQAVPWNETAIIAYLEDQGLIPPPNETT